MSKELEIFYIENAASNDVHANLSADLDKDIWQFGIADATYAWDVEDPRPKWWCDLVKNRWHETLMQNIVDQLELMDPNVKNYVFKLINCQGGGRTLGLDGSIHVDHDFEFTQEGYGFMTFCYFPHKEWDAEWGGELQFFNEKGEIIAAYLPMPNTAVVFDSNIPHRGLAPTKECPVLRKFISLKLQVHKSWILDDSVKFSDIKQIDNEE